MKKIIFVLLSIILMISGVLFADYTINKDFIFAEQISINKTNKTQKIVLDGNIREIGLREINIKYPLIISEIYKKAGDIVYKGEIIARADIDEYISQYRKTDYFDNNVYRLIMMFDPDIKSPVNGIVDEINIKKDERIDPEIPIIKLRDKENVRIKSKISKMDLNELYIGQNVEIALNGKNIRGKINSLEEYDENGYDQSFISFAVKPDTTDGFDFFGNDNVKIILNNRIYNDIISVPGSAVFFNENIPYVFVNISGYAVKINVKTGVTFSDNNIEITNGLKTGDRLIINSEISNAAGNKVCFERSRNER